jgi:hypothetical protein
VLPQIELSGPQCRNINLLPFHVSVTWIPCGKITLFLKLLCEELRPSWASASRLRLDDRRISLPVALRGYPRSTIAWVSLAYPVPPLVITARVLHLSLRYSSLWLMHLYAFRVHELQLPASRFPKTQPAQSRPKGHKPTSLNGDCLRHHN